MLGERGDNTDGLYGRAHFVNNSKMLGGRSIPPSPILEIKRIIHKAWSLGEVPNAGKKGYTYDFWGDDIRE